MRWRTTTSVTSSIAGLGYDVAYVIEHDPATFRGCEQVVRLSPDEAAAQATANADNS